MSRRLLVLIAGDPVPSARERFGSFADMFRRSADGAFEGEWSTLDLREEPELPSAAGLDGVIVSGSPASVTEGLPWMHRAVNYLGQLREHDVPTLGICFGHQLLGLMAGGRVEQNPSGRELGTVRMRVLGPSPLLDVEGEVVVNASHVDSVQDLPGHASTLGRTRLEANALVHFGARSWGVQFHPEFDREITSCYVRERRTVLLSEGLDPDALLRDAQDSPESRQVIPNFLRRVVLAQ